MKILPRIMEARVRRVLERQKSVLLLGPRQTGKTTLLQIVVCRTPRRFKLGPKITAVPWQEIPDVVTAML